MTNVPWEVAQNLLSPIAQRLPTRNLPLGMDNRVEAVLDTLRWLGRVLPASLPVSGFHVVELGPGRTPDMLAAFVLMGAASGTGVDVPIKVDGDATSPARYRALVELLLEPANAGILARFGASADSVAARFEELCRGAMPLEFAAYPGDEIPVAPGSCDLVISNWVLEHVRLAQVLPLLRSIERSLKPSGVMGHVIDLRDHRYVDGVGGQHGNWLEALTYSERVFNAMQSRRDTYVNRLRSSQWRDLIVRAGLQITAFEERRAELPAGFALSSLQSPWSAMSPEELAVTFIAVAARPGR